MCGQSVSAQGSTVQQIHVREGWNLVSLHVVPASTGIQDILAGHLDDMLIVQDDDGQAFVPSLGIDEIGTWDRTRSYLLFAWNPFVLEVEGAGLSADPPPVEIASGWSFIPYFPTKAMAVDEALASIGDQLVTAKRLSGHLYYPSDGVASLDSLHPGYGYQVFLSDEGFLQYPAEVPPAPDTTRVSLLADALALTGIPVGHIIEVQGYHEPGDGGGGRFEVTDTADGTDGGTCFVFDEDLSAEQTLVTNNTMPTLPHANLVWGTVSARVGGAADAVIPDLYMHGGQSWQQSTEPMLDHKTGQIYGGTGVNLFDIRRALGDGDSYDVTYRYRFATSNRRLRRVEAASAPERVDLAWWGTPEADSLDPKPATQYINWAIKVAHDRFNAYPIDWAYVDVPAEYYFHNEIRIRNGVKLRGSGPAINVPGMTWDVNGKLTVTPEKALYHLRDGYDQRGEMDIAGVLGQKAHINNHYLTEKWGFENLEIDGNYINNTAPFSEDPESEWDRAQVGGWLQNSGDWAGFHTNDSGSQSAGSDPIMYVDNVYVHSVGGNGMATGRRIVVNANNVLSENSVRNHSFYSFAGNTTNVGARGHSWAVPLKLGSKDDMTSVYTNMFYLAGDTNPEGYVDNEVFNIIGDNITMDGITVDLRGGPNRTGWITDRETSNVFKNATVHLNSSGGMILQMPRATPVNDVYSNFDIYSAGEGISIVRGANQSGMTFENFTIHSAEGTVEPATRHLFTVELNGEFSEKPMPARIDLVNMQHNREAELVFRGGGSPSGVPQGLPRELFVSNSYFNNIDFFNDGGGRWGFGTPAENYRNARFYLYGTTISLPASLRTPASDPVQRIGGGVDKAFKLRDVQDPEGRVSDQSGIFTSGVIDEGNDYVLIPTNLIFRAYEIEATLENSPTSITAISDVEVANSDGSLRSENASNQREPFLKVNLNGIIGQGETVEVSWAARVTPLSEYQTTGVFISRPVFNRSYELSAGAQTIDLRGVAVSQESKEPMSYTAVSENESVVSVSISSDGHTLEVNPNSAGTAIISVIGEIAGVGAATNTFETVFE